MDDLDALLNRLVLHALGETNEMEDDLLEAVKTIKALRQIADNRGEMLTKRRRERDHLSNGILAYLSGDYPNPRRHRPGPCPHGVSYFAGCEQCDAEYFSELLVSAAEEGQREH
jgi:hypothetical protein